MESILGITHDDDDTAQELRKKKGELFQRLLALIEEERRAVMDSPPSNSWSELSAKFTRVRDGQKRIDVLQKRYESASADYLAYLKRSLPAEASA